MSGRLFTGAGAILCAAHAGPDGKLHGHTWTIEAWWAWDETCACERQRQLTDFLATYDHDTLPGQLRLAEGLAQWVGTELECATVEVRREGERLFARWESSR